MKYLSSCSNSSAVKKSYKLTLLIFGFFACSCSIYADMLGINIELSRTKQNQAVVSIRAGYLTNYNVTNVSVQAAAKTIRSIKFDLDSKFAVVHSTDLFPLSDLMPIFEAMSANDIALFYLQIGNGPPTGMDIWKPLLLPAADTPSSGDVHFFRDQMPWGVLSKRLGTQVRIEGEYDYEAKLTNVLWVEAIDRIHRGAVLPIEIRGSLLQLCKGVHYVLEGYESGEFTGEPVWSRGPGKDAFQYKTFFVVTRVIKPTAKILPPNDQRTNLSIGENGTNQTDKETNANEP